MGRTKKSLLIILISVISILYICKSQALVSESITNGNPSSKIDSNGSNLPDYAKEVLRVFPKWEVIQFDEKPDLKVGGYDFYFENICSKPKSWRNYYNADLLKRNLEERPVPEEIIKAQETIRSLVFSTEEKASKAVIGAKQIIIESPDKEAALIIAFDLVKFNTKIDTDIIIQVREIGKDILRKLPEVENKKLYKIIEGSLDSEQDSDLLKKFQEILN